MRLPTKRRRSERTVSAQTVARHRTALSRVGLSRPIRLSLENGLIHADTSVFDYGCGRGDDLRALSSRGIRCQGWDPVYAPDTERRRADVINLGYVVNVIEDPQERAAALHDAWALTQQVLVWRPVSAWRLRPRGSGRIETVF